jgi:diguanylate cyclase (GGDEF)-like protein
MNLDNEIYNLIKLVSNTNEAYTSALFVAVPPRRQLVLRTIYTLSRNINEDITIDFGTGLIGWVAGNAKPLNASKFQYDSRNLPYYKKPEEIKSFLAVPVINDSNLIGVLCIDSKRSFTFTEKDQKILSGFADQFSLILQREKQLALLTEKSEDFQKLLNLHRELASESGKSILELIIDLSEKIVRFDTCSISLFDKDRTQLQVKRASGYSDGRIMEMTFPATAGIAGIVLRDKKGLLIPTLNPDADNFFIYNEDEPRSTVVSFMGIPLIAHDEPIGFLSYTRKEGPPFIQRDLQLVSDLADHAAMAIFSGQIREKLRKIVKLDSLTGLIGHSAFHEFIKQENITPDVRLFQTLLLVNPDNFQTINRRYGYPVGDEILRKMAQILTHLVDSQDMVCRYRGEEFAILLSDADKETGIGVARRILRAMEDNLFVAFEREINLTVSIGMATLFEDAEDPEELFLLARRALLSAKKKGKNILYTAGKKKNEAKQRELKKAGVKRKVRQLHLWRE